MVKVTVRYSLAATALVVLAVFVSVADCRSVAYGGLAIYMNHPSDGANVRGAFRPDYTLLVGEGPLADAVRANPHGARVCSALDGALLGCEPLAGGDGGDDGERRLGEVTPHGDGFGHGMHALEVRSAARSARRLGANQLRRYTHVCGECFVRPMALKQRQAVHAVKMHDWSRCGWSTTRPGGEYLCPPMRA